MRKLLFSTLILSLAFTSCKKDDEVTEVLEAVDCSQRTQEASDAAIAYSNDNSNANCLAYREALQTIIDERCAGTNAPNFQVVIDGLACN